MHHPHTPRPRMRLAARIALLLHALFFFALAMAMAAVLTGCTSLPRGIAATDEERAQCEASGCTVWTEQELTDLALRFFKRGHDSGYAKGQQARGTGI